VEKVMTLDEYERLLEQLAKALDDHPGKSLCMRTDAFAPGDLAAAKAMTKSRVGDRIQFNDEVLITGFGTRGLDLEKVVKELNEKHMKMPQFSAGPGDNRGDKRERKAARPAWRQ
jgi:hypothetical protein